MVLREPEAGQLALIFEDAGAGRRIWPVRELVGRAREVVEREFADVWVEGEISNLRPAASGHLYFTLKDAEAQLPVVMFRRQAALMRFRAEDGLHVLARGRVSIYDQRGQIQLVTETMEPVGAGSLQVAFEQLKEKLKKEGLFDAERKRALPAFPRTVGVVTSPTGAVIRDILNIVARRHGGLNILLCPVTVQGDSAAEEIEAAIALLNGTGHDFGLVDVIVVARGGGSLEDLAAFNSERVARAIVASSVPVVSAVGHETDFTIADFVADLRAPTPSAAAELITEAQHRVGEHVAQLEKRLERGAEFQLLRARQRMAHVSVSGSETRMTMLLHRLTQRLDDAVERMEEAVDTRIREHSRRVDALTSVIFRHDPRQRIALARHNFSAGQARLERVLERAIDARRARLERLAARLQSLSPLAVLERGYALVTDADGKLVRSAGQVATGEMMKTRLSDGQFTSRVEDVKLTTQKTRLETRRRK
jgi:exodeoxyribonuclease VII large subunit